MDAYLKLFPDVDRELNRAIYCGGPFEDGVDPSPMVAIVHNEVQKVRAHQAELVALAKHGDASKDRLRDVRFVSAEINKL